VSLVRERGGGEGRKEGGVGVLNEEGGERKYSRRN
jgi:hypothetical protein